MSSDTFVDLPQVVGRRDYGVSWGYLVRFE
jgi:hypothetical protein